MQLGALNRHRSATVPAKTPVAACDSSHAELHRKSWNSLAKAAAAACLALIPLAGAGCADFGPSGFIAPQELGRTSHQPLPVSILTSLGAGFDMGEEDFGTATPVTPADLQPIKGDYVIGRDDLLQISITDLAGPGIESIKQARVTESGNITLPYLTSVKAAGLTEAQLQDQIANAYQKAGLIAKAQVSVNVLEARQRVFSIRGAIARPGQYSIVNNNFRVLDALVLAGDVNYTGIEYMYIIRPGKEATPTTQPGGPNTTTPPQPSGTPAGPGYDPFAAPHSSAQPSGAQPKVMSARGSAQLIASHAGASDPAGGGAGASSQPSGQPLNTIGDDRTRTVYIGGSGTRPTTWTAGGANPTPAATGESPVTPAGPATPPVPPPVTPSATPPETPAVAPLPGAGTMPAENNSTPPGGNTLPGAEVPGAGNPTVLTPPEAELPPTTTPFTGFTGSESGVGARVIRIPLEKLLHGDLRYNIVVHPNDTLMIPTPEVARYYMGGHVLRTGVYDMTNQQITLKQAVISAGMLDELAIPQRTDLIRRIDKNHEIFVRVDLAKVFEGRQPDVYLKPNDEIMVGTNMGAPFVAAVRDAFRITYGFGFLYDRNYADYGPGANTGQ